MCVECVCGVQVCVYGGVVYGVCVCVVDSVWGVCVCHMCRLPSSEVTDK